MPRNRLVGWEGPHFSLANTVKMALDMTVSSCRRFRGRKAPASPPSKTWTLNAEHKIYGKNKVQHTSWPQQTNKPSTSITAFDRGGMQTRVPCVHRVTGLPQLSTLPTCTQLCKRSVSSLAALSAPPSRPVSRDRGEVPVQERPPRPTAHPQQTHQK